MCDTHGFNPRLLPSSRNRSKTFPKLLQELMAVQGHYKQWVEVCIAGYNSKDRCIKFAIQHCGPLTETVLMGNLAIRSYDVQKQK